MSVLRGIPLVLPLLLRLLSGVWAVGNVPADVFSCPDQFGYYPDMEDCSKYFVCVFGDALHESCTGGLYFSAELQTCDWPRNVQCATGVKPAPTPKVTQSSDFNRKLPGGGRIGPPRQPVADPERTPRVTTPFATTTTTTPLPPLDRTTPKRDPIYASQEEEHEDDDQFDLQQPQYGEAAPPVVDSEGGIHLSEGNLDPISGVSIYVKPIFPNSNADKPSSVQSRNKPEAKFDEHQLGGGRSADSNSRFLNFPPSLRTGIFNNNGRSKDPDIPASNPGTHAIFDQFAKSKDNPSNDESFLRHDPNDPSNVFNEARKSMDSEIDKVLHSNNGRSRDPDVSPPKDEISRNSKSQRPSVYYNPHYDVLNNGKISNYEDFIDHSFDKLPTENPALAPSSGFSKDTEDQPTTTRAKDQNTEGRGNKPRQQGSRSFENPEHSSDSRFQDGFPKPFSGWNPKDVDFKNFSMFMPRIPTDPVAGDFQDYFGDDQRSRTVPLKPTTQAVAPVASTPAPVPRPSRTPPSRPEAVYPTPVPQTPALSCDRKKCRLPDCRCGGTDIVGGLKSNQVPQIILLTFDDAVNDLNYDLYNDIFNSGRKNPNGCPILGTFYVSHEWTDYGQVQTLYSQGHEMASHSITHSYGEKFSKQQWMKEIHGQREILHLYGGVNLDDIRGMRAPFLQIGGNRMFEMLYESNFTYDSSMPIFENNPPFWPYTMDYSIHHECMITPCPSKSFPGLWEIGMVMWVDLRGGRCSMGDACSNPPDEDGVFRMLMKNFNRHYKSNRAPFGLFYHSAWFNTQHHRRGFLRFLDEILRKDDVWAVTNWQLIQWLRDPVPLSQINSFVPWQCNKLNRPPACHHPTVCNVWSQGGVRYMKTCQPCPNRYPWIGSTGFQR